MREDNVEIILIRKNSADAEFFYLEKKMACFLFL